MRLIDPTGSCDIRHNIRAPRLDSIQGLTVGLLSNSKAKADVLLRETASLFKKEHECVILDVIYKHNASQPAPRQLIDKLAKDCDLLLTATGD